MHWIDTVMREAVADGEAPARPRWSSDDVPFCDELCPHHDGKRCRLTGVRPGNLCEPVVVEMANLLRKKPR